MCFLMIRKIMLISQTSLVHTNAFPCPFPVLRNSTVTTLSKKQDFSEKSRKQNKPNIVFPFKFPSNKLLLQSAIGVFALGFIDAGYSGDWSRIGVITKDAENLLKLAAFLVVPLCVFLIVSLHKKVEE